MKQNSFLGTRILVIAISGILIWIPVCEPVFSYASAVSRETERTDSFEEESAFETDKEGKSQISLPRRIMDTAGGFFTKIEKHAAGMRHRSDKSYRPSVLSYNLMELYPEDTLQTDGETGSEEEPVLFAESSPEIRHREILRFLKREVTPLYNFFSLTSQAGMSETCGAQMYEYLSKKDAEWASGIYRWIQAAPEQAAGLLGRGTASVTGRYDPTNPDHDIHAPESWIIPAWKNVNFHFYDGDGRPISLRSNAREILSMASVYTYFTGWQDTVRFQNYIDFLWSASHSYQVVMGDVYYCDGCVNPAEALAKNGPENAETAENGDLDGQTENLPLPKEKGIQTAFENAQEASPSELSLPKRSEKAEGSDTSALSLAGNETDEEEAEAGSKSSDNDVKENGPEETLMSDVSKEALIMETAGGTFLGIPLNAEGKYCPGHADLTITVHITGLSEQKNLFTIDSVGRETNDNWSGWSAYRKSYVQQLEAMDWERLYGLVPLELALGKPLSYGEVSDYMNLLPADLSSERRALIRCALESVGKIPYYYGGKAVSSGYEKNCFGDLTIPDRKGRVMRGLDCSGWIHWVYWTSQGQPPASQGTGGLIHAGRAVSREALSPGDLMIRLGGDSHVAMFLGWAPGGGLLCIHETGGSTNNVTVSVMNGSWPYYRALLD